MSLSSVVFIGALVAIAAAGSMAFIQDPNNIQIGYHPSSMNTIASSTNTSDGLELKLSLNATSVRSGDAVNISLAEYNTLAVVNNVTASSDWPILGLTDGACGTLNNPIGFEVFYGYYTDSNISSATPLELYPPGLRSCPMILSGIDSYVFQPGSSEADVYGSCSPGLCFAKEISSGGVVRGYWGSGFLTGSTYQALSLGVYSVAAGDEWGSLTILYFVVS